MFSENLVAAIKVNGEFVREIGNNVYLPFGTEYSIFIKNLNTKNAVVKIFIDGDCVTDGDIIVYKNSTAEIKGFIKDLKIKNKFKFIKKTEKISNYRGNKIEDGLIRIEYKFEKEELPVIYYTSPIDYSWINPYFNYTTSKEDNNKFKSSSVYMSSVSENNSLIKSELTFVNSAGDRFSIINEPGITVPGTKINEKLNTASIGKLEEKTNVIIIKLVGENENQLPINNIKTTSKKIKCKICGTYSNSKYNFCPECGASLE